ncbi:MAG: hypothetical protein E6J00_08735 [Chloroflexi bacterium]|nr:MAG: hypothetical protein E6J00_08735 [Chloroflexota bacterium]
MLLLQDALGLLRRPRATLARIDGRRGGGHGLTGICLSATLPALVAELAALGPYSGPSGLGAPPREIRLLSEAFFRWLYQERFLLPLVDLLLGAALWLLAVALIHWVARRLGSRGSFSGYLGLCGPIAAIGAVAVPVSLVEAGLRAAGQAAVADALSPLVSSLGLLAFAWQNVLLVIAAARHYSLSQDRAITVVIVPAAAVAVVLFAVVITGTVLLVMALGSTG